MKARNKPTGFLQTLLVIACTCCISLMALAGGIKTPDVSPHVDISHRADPPTRVDYGSQNAANSSSYDSSTTNTTGSYDVRWSYIFGQFSGKVKLLFCSGYAACFTKDGVNPILGKTL